MKKLLALILIAVMVLSMAAACGDDGSSASTGSDAQGSAAAGENNADASTLTFKGITFTIPGDFEEMSVRDNAAAYSNGTFTVSVNHHETTYDIQEELAKSNAKSLQKTYPDASVEIIKNETTGIFYYTIKGTDTDHASCDYIVGDVYLTFITSNLSEEALNTISSVKIEK